MGSQNSANNSTGSTPSSSHNSPTQTQLASRAKLLSEQHQRTLQESWDIIDRTPGGHAACIRAFYRTILEKGGDHIRRMFAYTDMQKQQHMLTAVIQWALGNNFNEEGLKRIGVLHSHLGVAEEDIIIFRDCFINTLTEVSGAQWRNEFRDAWDAVFNSISRVMVPSIQEADKVIDTVTHSEIGSSAMSSAHLRLMKWFQERVTPTGDGSVRFSLEEPQMATTVNYAIVRAPLRVAPEYSKRLMELHGRILYLNKTDGKPGGFVDLRSVNKVENTVNSDHTQFIINIETHEGKLLHFLSFDSETLQEKWLVTLTKHVKQFSSMEPAPSPQDIDALTNAIFSEKERLEFKPSDFEYLTLIGKGSFGKVVKVQHKVTHKIYAMKIIQKSSFSTVRNIVEVRRERAILETVDSPFIVKFYGYFQSEDRLYFLFDFLSGGELFYHTKCAPDHHFNEETCRFYTAEIACALEHLRIRNIVHRDIKGDNFVLDGDGHVVLTDFGFAKSVDKAKRNTATCGTLAYIAPEVLAPGPGGYGYEVDWWSLGVVLFTMLTGFFPFLRPTPPETAKAIVYEPLRFPSTIPTTHNARSLCRNLMHKNPKQRITSLADLQAHPFFAGFDWEKLMTRQMRPPFVPDQVGANTKYFHTKFTQLKNSELNSPPPIEDSMVSPNSIAREKNVFSSFFFEQEVFASEMVLQKLSKGGASGGKMEPGNVSDEEECTRKDGLSKPNRSHK